MLLERPEISNLHHYSLYLKRLHTGPPLLAAPRQCMSMVMPVDQAHHCNRIEINRSFPRMVTGKSQTQWFIVRYWWGPRYHTNHGELIEFLDKEE